MKLPHADFSVLGLGIKWRGGFWALGFGVRMRGESSGMSRAGHGEVREWLGEREESDLNDVGQKMIGSGETGQTGRPYRSDRSRPICQQKFF